MSLSFETNRERPLEGKTVFVSASIPDPVRWTGQVDPLEITDAVVSMARVFLTAGANLVTAAHPTIAPLLLYVAAELPPEYGQQIITYQSDLFEDVLPPATRRFQDEKIGRFVWTPAAPNERPEPGHWHESLAIMRREMLEQSCPSAAVFVGGMEGIRDEFALFADLCPHAPTYPIGRPGGEARTLAEVSDLPIHAELSESAIYPALWRHVIADLRGHSS